MGGMSQTPKSGGNPLPSDYSGVISQRLSRLAVASLVLGGFVCIPAVTGLAAIGTGIGGILATRKSALRGGRLAVAGIVLGVINLAFWGCVYNSWRGTTGPMRSESRQLIVDLSAGNFISARGDCVESISDDQIRGYMDFFKKRGSVKSIRTSNGSVDYQSGFTTGKVSCEIEFADGSRARADLSLIYRGVNLQVYRAEFN